MGGPLNRLNKLEDLLYYLTDANYFKAYTESEIASRERFDLWGYKEIFDLYLDELTGKVSTMEIDEGKENIENHSLFWNGFLYLSL